VKRAPRYLPGLAIAGLRGNVGDRGRRFRHIEVGHRSTSACLVANISYHAKKRVEWDRESERVTNVPEANKYLHKEYRAPWKLF